MRPFFISFAIIFFSSLIHSQVFSKNIYSQEKIKEISYTVVEIDGKKGLKNGEGKIVIPALYEDIGWSKGKPKAVNNVLGYKENGKWGLIKLENKKVTSPTYQELYHENGTLVASLKNKVTNKVLFGSITTTGKEAIPFMYYGLKIIGEGAIVASKSSKRYLYGLVNKHNNTILPLKYRAVNFLGEGMFAPKDINDKVALFDHHGQQLTPFQLDSIGAMKNGFAITYMGYQLGIVNKDGKMVVDAIFKEIKITEGSAKLKPFNNWEVLNAKNEKLGEFKFDHISPISPEYLKCKANGFEWVATRDGKPVTPTHYTYLFHFEDGKAIFSDKGKFGVLNIKKDDLLPAIYDSIIYAPPFIYTLKYNDGLSNWSIYDTFGIEKTKFKYQHIGSYNGRLFPVKRRGHWGFSDRVGNEVVNCVYDTVHHFVNDKVVVKFHGEYGVIGFDSEWVILPQKHEIEIVDEHLFLLKNENQTQLQSFKGELIYFTNNDLQNKGTYLIEKLEDGRLWKIEYSGTISNLYKNGKFGKSYEEIHPPSEGYYGIKLNGRYGFIDENELLRIANRYDGIGPFKEGLAAVKIIGKWGFINKSESIVIQPSFTEVSNFNDGIAIVKKNGLYGLIDPKGKNVVPPAYESIEILENGRYLIRKNGKFGLLDKHGRQLINAKFDAITDLGNGYAIVYKNKKSGLITINGLSTIPMIYKSIIYDPYDNAFFAEKESSWINKTLQTPN